MSNEHYMMSKRCDAERSALYQCSDVDDEINTAIDVRVLKPTTKKHCKGIRHSITGGFWRKMSKYTFWKWWRLVQFFDEATIRRWKEERNKSHLNRPLIYCNRTKRIGDLEFYEANTWANDHIQRRTHINGQELATCRGLYQYTTDLSHQKVTCRTVCSRRAVMELMEPRVSRDHPTLKAHLLTGKHTRQ